MKVEAEVGSSKVEINICIVMIEEEDWCWLQVVPRTLGLVLEEKIEFIGYVSA